MSFYNECKEKTYVEKIKEMGNQYVVINGHFIIRTTEDKLIYYIARVDNPSIKMKIPSVILQDFINCVKDLDIVLR